MEVDTKEIMNEVDELLGKLDTLPEEIRSEVLKKLTQKVSNSHIKGPKKCRSSNKVQHKPSNKRVSSPLPSAHPRIVKVKEEPVAETGDVKETDPLATPPVEPQPLKTEIKIPQNVISSGRRLKRKVDYKHLSEFGLDEDIDTEITANNGFEETRERPHAKRGRGRPKKPPEEIAESAGSFDLLESCLKESGIKAVTEKPFDQEKTDSVQSEKNSSQRDAEADHIEHNNKESMKKDFGCDSVKPPDIEDDDGSDKKLVFYSPDSVYSDKKKSTDSKYKCKDCGKMYSSLSVLKTHQVRHRKREELPFPCKQCDFRAASKIELSRHNQKHNRTLEYTCHICKKEFARDTGLREHLLNVHHKSETFRCGLCPYSTPRRSTMRDHLRCHQGKVPVIACPVCSIIFRSKANLRTHLLSHAGVKEFQCDICQKKFINQNRVKAHKINVHGPKDHDCSYCEMKFPTLHALNRHLRVHTGEKPFQCCFCSFVCNTHGNLLKHIRTVHDRINFTYKDLLKECQMENSPKYESKRLEEMHKEGKDYASKVLRSIGEATGEKLTLEKLKEEEQKKKECKVAAFLEHQIKKKKRIVRRSTFNSGGKEAATDAPPEDSVYVENGLSSFSDVSAYWLINTDESGCVMFVPWDGSLMENDDGEEEEGQWKQDIQVDKIVKVGSTSGSIPFAVSKDEEISLEKFDDSDVETLEINRDTEEKTKFVIEGRNSVVEVSDLNEVVDKIDSLNDALSVETTPSITVSSDKKVYKDLPKTLQVITSSMASASASSATPSVSNFVLPEGYIVEDDGQSLQLGGTNLLQLQMGQVINSPESPDVALSKFSDNVYSFSTPEGDKEATLVITTGDKDDEVDIKEFSKISRPKPFNTCSNVNLLPMKMEEEEGNQQSALVLIVDASDEDK